MADSWKTNGDCHACRRAAYCGKPCAKHRALIASFVRRMIADKTGAGIVMNALREMEGRKSE